MWDYLHRSSLALVHHPTPEAVTAQDFVLRFDDCQSCPYDVRVYMLLLSVVLGGKVKKVIERVSLSLYLPLCSVCDVQWCMFIFCDFQVPLPEVVSQELSGAS